MKQFMLLLLILLVTACGGRGEETFSYGGTDYRLAGTPRELPALLSAGRPAALRFTLAGYGQVMQALAVTGQESGVALKPLLTDDLFVCAACRRRLESHEVFELLHMAGKTADEKRCPACGSTSFMMFFKRSAP